MGVYFDDLDMYKVLHNARYLLLFERTLGSFWQVTEEGEAFDNTAHSHLVRTNSIEYLRPVRGTGQVRVRVWIEKLGRTSMTFAFRMMPMNEDVDYAVGSRVVVCVDPENYRPVPWSDGFRKRISPWVHPD